MTRNAKIYRTNQMGNLAEIAMVAKVAGIAKIDKNAEFA